MTKPSHSQSDLTRQCHLSGQMSAAQSVEHFGKACPSAAPLGTAEDANNYCRILTLLGMEEEGDPVAEVERLVSFAAPQGAQPAERSAKDYAIEHAEYMAQSAEHLLAMIEALSAAELHREETGEDDGAVHDARDVVWESVRGLHSHIYEFRKRRDRAAESPADAAPVPQEVRMLTTREVMDCECGDFDDTAKHLQRTFCEVNGLTIPAKEQTK